MQPQPIIVLVFLELGCYPRFQPEMIGGDRSVFRTKRVWWPVPGRNSKLVYVTKVAAMRRKGEKKNQVLLLIA